jgi:hypothetical protein
VLTRRDRLEIMTANQKGGNPCSKDRQARSRNRNDVSKVVRNVGRQPTVRL